MKHLSGLLNKLTAVAAVAVALTSCNRAEYAMLPKTSSAYHGTQRGVIVKPAPATAVVTPKVAAPAVAEVEAPVVATPTAPVAAENPVVASAPAAAPKVAAPAEAVRPEAKKAFSGVKLNAVQKAALAKIDKKADKIAAKLTKKDTASANAISSNLKLGIILVLIGALITILPGGIFDLLGSIVAIIGIVFIILALLDMA
ncbi:hypothetical protein [Hymenobacter tenuis]